MNTMQCADAIATRPLQATPAPVAKPQGLSKGLTFLLAAAGGFSVASIYYSQPMLGSLSGDIGATTRQVGWIPTLTQLGYAFGILLLAPLGDRYDRRRIILGKATMLTLALLLAAAAPSLGVLLVASLAIGIAATMAQDIVPAAAAMAPEQHRGKVIGTVMTGLLLGILLSRVISGLLAEQSSWRTVFAAASVSIAAIGIAVWRGLPSFAPTTQLGYGALLGSLGQLWLRYPKLRRAAIAQAFMSVGFSAFWSTLAVMLHGEPFHLGSAAAGAFGIAGVVGALGAPLAGRLSDRRGPELTTRLGTGLAAVSFALLALGPLLPVHGQIALIALCAVGFDLGVQATLIAHQSIVYGIEPGARSRLNAVLVVGMFVGMAPGAALGSWLLADVGWIGVIALSTLSAAIALGVRLWPSSKK